MVKVEYTDENITELKKLLNRDNVTIFRNSAIIATLPILAELITSLMYNTTTKTASTEAMILYITVFTLAMLTVFTVKMIKYGIYISRINKGNVNIINTEITEKFEERKSDGSHRFVKVYGIDKAIKVIDKKAYNEITVGMPSVVAVKNIRKEDGGYVAKPCGIAFNVRYIGTSIKSVNIKKEADVQ